MTTTPLKTIIWDFNGTLLNDMQVCIDCMNLLLKERDLPVMDLARYREVFAFPVRDYYQVLGFDFSREPFEIPAHQFIDLYRIGLHSAPLQPGAVDMLKHFRRLGFNQIILSAMEQGFLEETLAAKGIMEYFETVAGIRDHLADGKLEMAREILKHHDLQNSDYILVGDTLHDFEVAHGLGITCILVARGHQSYERLKNLDCRVLKDISELKEEIR
jgi:phosphoglycolate phosphatase